ncbi:uncharacterized protein LOC115349606 isoform X2 [Aquila chrysaetos chrysaetos]|uniref:uncharacterized protein LOC115349606 isoform X2 n=1 Tax=Aquila chrysaetos chrysaetos TaxID=223781 RepID=UPI0011768376|nr:uncharacterized protein LOC115349606 isoform X2 [Aquila chrysaetos chrysaetos]
MRGAAAPGARLGPGLLRRGGEEKPGTPPPPRPLGAGTVLVLPQPGARSRSVLRRVNGSGEHPDCKVHSCPQIGVWSPDSTSPPLSGGRGTSTNRETKPHRLRSPERRSPAPSRSSATSSPLPCWACRSGSGCTRRQQSETTHLFGPRNRAAVPTALLPPCVPGPTHDTKVRGVPRPPRLPPRKKPTIPW